MIRGFVLTFGLFAASFALHIVGGATDQGWLFIIAVALIFATATGFPAIMHAFAGRRARSRQGRRLWIVGTVAGVILTASALWAVNDRSMAWWLVPAGLICVAIVSPALWVVMRPRLGTTTRKIRTGGSGTSPASAG